MPTNGARRRGQVFCRANRMHQHFTSQIGTAITFAKRAL
jgi:hypothetical protein